MVFISILQFETIENLERANVSHLMLSAKQGNHWYHSFNYFGMMRPLAGIEPGTSHTRREHSTTRLSRRYQRYTRSEQ